MSKSTIWYGYLEAGDKSTAVAIDERLNTGNPNTLYVFNLARGKILEYTREIAEAKLRELAAEEAALVAELKPAFDAARREFNTRGAQILNLPERGQTRPARDSTPEDDDPADEDSNFDDLDLDLDEEDAEEYDEVEEM